ncbi:MAG: hypothetical protein ABIG60_03705, partial [Patescibacteria group bacterium]
NYYNNQRRHRGYGMNRMTPKLKITSVLFNSLNIIQPEKVTCTLQSHIFCHLLVNCAIIKML